MDDPWFRRPLATRAPAGGLVGVDGKPRRGGEFEPFYIPRPVMPQLDEADYPGFLAFCSASLVSVTRRTFDPSEVRPHQRIDHDKARHMDAAGLAKPIMVSVEPFILDGHHRWWEHNALHTPVDSYVLGLPFAEAVAFMFSFPKVYAYGDGQPHPEAF